MENISHSLLLLIQLRRIIFQIAGASGEFVIEECEQYGKEHVHYRYGSCIREGKERDLPFQFGFMQVHDTETVSYYETVKVLLKYMRDGCMYRKRKMDKYNRSSIVFEGITAGSCWCLHLVVFQKRTSVRVK